MPRSLAFAAALWSFLLAPGASAKVYQNTQSFLSELGSNCPQIRETLYLTETQFAKLPKGSSALVVRHKIECKGLTRWVYFDSHRVRTQPETLAVVVKQDGSLDQVKILSFDEPEEYLPKPKWYATFQSKKLGADLALHRDIPMITGATLSARSATEAVRKVLTLHESLQ